MEYFNSWWIFFLIIFGLLFVALGVLFKKGPLGILIDSRNKMSLSRLQIICWTWILLSAFLAVAIAARTTNIEMKPEIWALMGISVVSTLGSTIVKENKSMQEPAVKNIDSSKYMGLLCKNVKAEEAKIADLFKGEEQSDHEYVDITKVQMFIFTLVLVGAYAGYLWTFTWVRGTEGVINFPEFSESMVVLLGISHGGYLGVKATTKTRTV